jgi:hypothetical protein
MCALRRRREHIHGVQAWPGLEGEAGVRGLNHGTMPAAAAQPVATGRVLGGQERDEAAARAMVHHQARTWRSGDDVGTWNGAVGSPHRHQAGNLGDSAAEAETAIAIDLTMQHVYTNDNFGGVGADGPSVTDVGMEGREGAV